MGDLHKLENPSPIRWVLAVLATVVAVAVIYVMILFAQAANADNKLVNWFGIATALGGALVFELLKFSFTVRSRHLEELANKIQLTPAKMEELAKIVDEVNKKRQLYAGISTAVELRAKALAFEAERKQLAKRALEVQRDSTELVARQHRLALDIEANESADLAKEMAEVVDKLGVSRQDRIFEQLWKSIGAVPGLPAGYLVGKIAEAAQHQMERIMAKRSQSRISDLELELELDPDAGSSSTSRNGDAA